MLTALETGVKGGRWFSLMDKVYAPANLAAAWKRVRVPPARAPSFRGGEARCIVGA
jgi:hypothetical protein